VVLIVVIIVVVVAMGQVGGNLCKTYDTY